MARVIRIALLGTLPGGEQWSVNPTFATLTDETVSYEETLQIATGVNAITIPTGVRAIASTSTFFSGARVEARGIDGGLEAQSESLRATPLAGTGASAHPFQTSCVLSLRTGAPGASGRGRLYLPATGMAVTPATLRLDTAVLTSFISGMKTWLAAIEDAAELVLGSPTPLSVWSRTREATYAVNRMLAGDVADVQRRRRDAVPETYQQLVYP